MQKKFLLVIIALQTFVMLGLIYFLWGKRNKEFFFNENFLLFLTTVSLAFFFLGLILHAREQKKIKKAVRLDGMVKWYNPNKGFGFIEQDIGGEVFVHQTEIMQSGFRFLNLGDRVEFEIGRGKKGPVALKVVRTKTAEQADISDYSKEPELDPITKFDKTN